MYFEVYVIEGCPFCARALNLLTINDLKTKIHVVEPNQKEKIKKKHHMNTFPQIFYVNEKRIAIGGCVELEALLDVAIKIKEHKLDIKIINDIITKLKIFKNINK